MKRKILLLTLIFMCLCLCSVAISFGELGQEDLFEWRGYYGYSIAYEPGEGEPPGGGNCQNQGVIYPENPFRGWPLDYQMLDMGSISFAYCAPYPDGTPHWGLDFGGNDVEGSRVLLTTTRAIVRQANSCLNVDDCWNYGMGRMVQVEAQIPVDDYDECVALQAGDREAADFGDDGGGGVRWRHCKLQIANCKLQIVKRRTATAVRLRAP